jgi:hypothetical protein
MKYTVYEWHLGSNGLVAENLTVDEVMALDFKYIKFNKTKDIAWVTNCCDFKMH